MRVSFKVFVRRIYSLAEFFLQIFHISSLKYTEFKKLIKIYLPKLTYIILVNMIIEKEVETLSSDVLYSPHKTLRTSFTSKTYL